MKSENYSHFPNKLKFMKHFALLFFLFYISAFSVSAQTAKNGDLKQCDALFAKQLVEQQAAESKSVAETDKRINILLKSAEFLWKSDGETARRYFAEAFQVAEDRFAEKGNEPLITGNMILRRIDYRFEVIRTIGKYDAEWAKKLSEKILDKTKEDKEKTDSRNEQDEAKNTRDLAVSLAESNPSAALYFARRAMRYPLLRDWYFTLNRIAEKNQPLADQIYTELLNNYPGAPISDLVHLSAYPFGNTKVFGVAKVFMFGNVPENFTPNQNLQKQFLQMFLRRVISLNAETSDQMLYPYSNVGFTESAFAKSALSDIEPIVAQKFPELNALFRQAQTNVNALISAEQQNSLKKMDDKQKDFGVKTFDDRIKELEKADSEGVLEDGMIVNLVISAKKEEDFKKLETWLDKIKDEELREGAVSYFYFNRSKLAVKEKRYLEAEKHADRLNRIELKAVLYFDIADAKFKEPNTKFDSLNALAEVSKLAEKSPDSVEKAQVLLGMAYIYEKIDHFNAIDSLSKAIKTANNLESPNLLSGVVSQRVASKDFGGYYINYAVPGFDINKTFTEISKNDFQGALSQANSFSDKYLRTLAILAIVKDCGKKEKSVKAKQSR